MVPLTLVERKFSGVNNIEINMLYCGAAAANLRNERAEVAE